MPNEPDKAREKRPPPPERQNDQGDAEGSAHRPEGFDVLNPSRDPGVRRETERSRKG